MKKAMLEKHVQDTHIATFNFITLRGMQQV